MKYESLALLPELKESLKAAGYQQLTPIQQQSLPALLEGKDFIGQSKTGSGKTAAFTLPILNKVQLQKKRVQALVLCPTRELCTQVAGEIRKLGRKQIGLQVVVLCGGMPMGPQYAALERGIHIVVGTPGRVIDHLDRGSLDLSEAGFLVLDEADRMLDMGFSEEVEHIIESTPEDRQTIFFSATFPDNVEELSERYQNDPVRVTITNAEPIPDLIEQRVYITEQDNKFDLLVKLLMAEKPASALVFCNLKITVQELAHELARHSIGAKGLHGDLEQWDRDAIMAGFRNGSIRVLIATDVAARGLDVDSLAMVVNYDFPNQQEIYVHRIGRTGRAGKKGLAVSFVTEREADRKLRDWVDDLELKIKECSEDELIYDDGPTNSMTAAMSTLIISGGRKEKMRPGDILGALTGEGAGLAGEDVGKIEIHDMFSYVAVSKRVAKLALERLRMGRIKGRRFRVDLV